MRALAAGRTAMVAVILMATMGALQAGCGSSPTPMAPETAATISGVTPLIANATTQSFTVSGNGFQAGLVLAITPSGGSPTVVSGTQITGVTSTSFQATAVVSSAGTYAFQVANPSTASAPFSVVVQAAPTVSKLTVAITTQSASTFVVGGTEQLSATATMSDATQKDVTAQASWQSSNGFVAIVSPGGLVTATYVGTATLTATYQGQSASITQLIAQPLAFQIATCGSGKVGTYDSLACSLVITAATNPNSTGLQIKADLSGFGPVNTFGVFVLCYGCGQIEYDLTDLNIPVNMSPGRVAIPVTVSDAQGRTAFTTVHFTVLPALISERWNISRAARLRPLRTSSIGSEVGR
jgi:hypothetical protein